MKLVLYYILEIEILKVRLGVKCQIKIIIFFRNKTSDLMNEFVQSFISFLRNILGIQTSNYQIREMIDSHPTEDIVEYKENG